MGLKVENKFKKPSLYVDVETRTSGNASDRPWDDRSDLEIRYEQLKAENLLLKDKLEYWRCTPCEAINDANKVLNVEIQQLKSKLKIAVDKLKYVSRHLDDGHIVDETISEIGGEM